MIASLSTIVPSSSCSIAPAGVTSTVFTVTVPSVPTVKLIVVSTFSYPAGAAVSTKVYSPGVSSRVITSSFLDVHVSSTASPVFAFVPVTVITAPSTSSPPRSVLLIFTGYSLRASSIRITPSVLVLAAVVTVPFSFKVNVISVAISYPVGATVSLRVYSTPVLRPSIRCASVPDTHSSTVFPSASSIWIVAPATSLLSAISTLDTLTEVMVLVTITLLVPFPVIEVMYPSTPTSSIV